MCRLVQETSPNGEEAQRAVSNHEGGWLTTAPLSQDFNSHSCSTALWNFQTRFGPAMTFR